MGAMGAMGWRDAGDGGGATGDAAGDAATRRGAYRGDEGVAAVGGVGDGAIAGASSDLRWRK
jgi:hypothetical protein